MAEFIWGMFVGAFIAMAGLSLAFATTAFKNIRGHSSDD